MTKSRIELEYKVWHTIVESGVDDSTDQRHTQADLTNSVEELCSHFYKNRKTAL